MTRVAILGTGLIGASIGLRLRAAGVIREPVIVGFDRYRDALAAAKRVGAVDQTESDPVRAVRGAGLVILAAPILANHQLMEWIAPALEPDAIVTDTGSTKAATLREAERILGRRVAFVGGHPMAGKTPAGAAAADPALFEGARWAVVPPSYAPESAVQACVAIVEAMGAEPMFMDAEEHDAYVAAISHLPLMAATAIFRLARASEAWPELSLLAAGGFKDTTRVAGTDPAITYDIVMTNREQIAHWIDRLRETLAEMRDLLRDDASEEALFKLLAHTEIEYAAYRAGKVGREVQGGVDIPNFDFSTFLMGEALREKMQEITKLQEERVSSARVRDRRDL